MLGSNKKKGFTLVELIVSIVLLAVVGVVVIYNMTNVATTSKEKDYEKYIASVISSANTYADLNKEAFNELYVNKSYIYITVGDLIKNSLIDENLTNPYTGENIGPDEIIKANLDSVSGDIIFEYPFNKEEMNKETFLSTVSDYVVWGEGYECMTGAGTYQLALSDEKGNLIDIKNDENIAKYNFDCKLPDDFDSKKAGTYDVIYSWLTESGTRKEAKRTLRVLPKVTPTFAMKEVTLTNPTLQGETPTLTGSATDFNYNGNKYTPKYTHPNQWTVLGFSAYIEGVDPNTTTFTVTRTKPGKMILIENSNNFGTVFQVVDGKAEYKIVATIKGHHKANYSYNADATMNTEMDIIIPKEKISQTNPNASYFNTYSISDTYSPIGVKAYDYQLKNTTTNKTTTIKNQIRSGVNTNISHSLLGGACNFEENSLNQFYVRARNNDDYVGSWQVVDTNLTNNMLKLNIFPVGTRYNSKSYYININSQLFNILEVFSGRMLVAHSTGLGPVTPTTLKTSSWGLQTCDGYFSTRYKALSPVLKTIRNADNQILNYLPNYQRYLILSNWTYNSCTKSNSCSYAGQYTSYAGNLNNNLYSRYTGALSGPHRYWSVDTTTSSFEIYVDTPFKHGEHTTAYNTFFYALTSGGSLSNAYGGNSSYVKPLLNIDTNKMYLCNINGNIYTIAT